MYKFCTFLFLYDEIIFSKKEKKNFFNSWYFIIDINRYYQWLLFLLYRWSIIWLKFKIIIH